MKPKVQRFALYALTVVNATILPSHNIHPEASPTVRGVLTFHAAWGSEIWGLCLSHCGTVLLAIIESSAYCGAAFVPLACAPSQGTH